MYTLIRVTLPILLLGLLSACGILQRGKPPALAPPQRMAVLPFTVRGDGLGEASGHIAADRFTTLLSSRKQLPVVERSFVNAALLELGIGNSYFLSRERLMALADTLQADVVVLGLLENNAASQQFQNRQYHLRGTVRFLSAASGDILLLREAQLTSEEDVRLLLSRLLTSIVSSLDVMRKEPVQQAAKAKKSEVLIQK